MTDIWMHEDSVTVAIPKTVNGIYAPTSNIAIVEITDECIEQIADAVVRKLMDVEQNDE